MGVLVNIYCAQRQILWLLLLLNVVVVGVRMHKVLLANLGKKFI